MCNLAGPEPSRRSSGGKLLKLLLIALFLIGATQLFALSYHFVRLLCYLVLDTQQFPPKSLPKRISLFGIELLQFSNFDRNDSNDTLYVAQAVIAAVMSIIIGTVVLGALIREHTRCACGGAIAITIMAFVTMFAAVSFPALLPFAQIAFPLTGAVIAVISIIAFVLAFSARSSSRFRENKYDQYYHPPPSAYDTA